MGACIKHLDISNILQLLKYAHNKLKVTFETEDLDNIVKKSGKFLDQIQNPLENHQVKDEEYHIVEMVTLNYTQIV